MSDPSRSQLTPPPSPFLSRDASTGGLPEQPAEAPLTPWIEALLLSVISGNFYVEVIRRWKGLGFVYLGCVMLLVGIPCAMKLHAAAGDYLRVVNDVVVPQMPRIEIKGGKANADGPLPHTIYQDPKNPKSTPLAFIDTKADTIDTAKRQEYVLVSHNMIYLRVGTEPGEFAPMQLGEDQVLDGDMIHAFCIFMTYVAGWVFYPMLVLRNFLFWAMHALLLAGLSSLMMMGHRIGAKFSDLIRMCAVACTPAIFLDTVAFLVDIRWDIWSMVLAVVAVMYVTTALRAAAEDMAAAE